MKKIFINLNKITALFYVLLIFGGCANDKLEMIKENKQKVLRRALVTRSDYSNDTIVADNGKEYEIVDGVALNMSITTVMADVTKLYGTARYFTINNSGSWVERAYSNEKYCFDFVGRHLYEGKNPYIEEPLYVYPEDGLCIPTDGSNEYITLRLSAQSSNILEDNESEFLYIRYILSYISDEYRYGKLENNGGKFYKGSITLPINSINYDQYISIDDFRISDSSGQWGPRFW